MVQGVLREPLLDDVSLKFLAHLRQYYQGTP